MTLHLTAPSEKTINSAIRITESKSETNRLLLLQALYPSLKLENISNSDDAEVMKKGLDTSIGKVDIHHAGTAMRFLTSYFSSQEGKEIELTGSSRMKQRPIKILVEALRSLGADIEYLEKEGFPPLKIKGQQLDHNAVSLPANISSQYISSLCLIGASLKNGLTIELVGKITSVPYIKMTLALLEEVGIKTKFEGNRIQIGTKETVKAKNLVVESDWSAASYYYSVMAMAEIGSVISLSAYKENSLQGDSILSELYQRFGVTTDFYDNEIHLKKVSAPEVDAFEQNLSDAPDIAQTIAVTCLGLGMGCHLTGLHTLPIKETDRLVAMKTELEKFGAQVTINSESLRLLPLGTAFSKDVSVDTYNDHRMAMAFAPLAMKTSFFVKDAGVVSKSYPEFWNDFEKVGFGVSKG